MKIISYLFVFASIIAFFYGFLVVKEYVRYYIRLLHLRLDRKLERKK